MAEEGICIHCGCGVPNHDDDCPSLVEGNTVIGPDTQLVPGTRTYAGYLEVDYNRGVVYFHDRRGVTVLRICRLGKIPEQTLIDVTHMHGVSFTKDEVPHG